MPNARMFDDIHSLDVGDVFVLWTLREPYAYRVFDVQVVEPDDTGSLEPQPGRDIVALVTCTPINVNSHRLVVYGERCEYEPESSDMRQSIESVASRRTIPLFVGVGVVGAMLVFLLVRSVRRRHAAH
jgi:sortase A